MHLKLSLDADPPALVPSPIYSLDHLKTKKATSGKKVISAGRKLTVLSVLLSSWEERGIVSRRGENCLQDIVILFTNHIFLFFSKISSKLSDYC